MRLQSLMPTPTRQPLTQSDAEPATNTGTRTGATARVIVGACVAAITVLALATARAADSPSPAVAAAIPFKVLATYPHDPSAFTQGLLFHDGHLYESTGLRGRSELRRVEPSSGKVLVRRPLAAHLFGEGLALANDRLFQLTWVAGQGFIYGLPDLAAVGQFRYDGEGWGLAFDGRLLWMSDGSDRLTRRAPFGFRQVGEPLAVRFNGRAQAQLNELEFVDGMLFANIWKSDRVVRIDPASGEITGWLDLSGLLSRAERARADVLNGLAWDSKRRVLMVTGKLWPKLFVLKLRSEQKAQKSDSD